MHIWRTSTTLVGLSLLLLSWTNKFYSYRINCASWLRQSAYKYYTHLPSHCVHPLLVLYPLFSACLFLNLTPRLFICNAWLISLFQPFSARTLQSDSLWSNNSQLVPGTTVRPRCNRRQAFSESCCCQLEVAHPRHIGAPAFLVFPLASVLEPS